MKTSDEKSAIKINNSGNQYAPSREESKLVPKKEGYWAGVGRRFKMDWEYSKPTILGSLTGSVVLVAIVLFIIKLAFEEAFLDSLIFVLTAFFFFVASGFVFRYMIPEKTNKLIAENDNNLKRLAKLEEQMVNDIRLKDIANQGNSHYL